MNVRLFSFASSLATAMVLSLLAACSGDPLPQGAAGSPAVPTAGSSGSPATAGAGGTEAGGPATSGSGGSSGAAVAGATSGGSGGATAGSSPGGSTAGSDTAGGGGSEIPATFAMVAALIKDRGTAHSCFGGSCHDGEHDWFHLLGEDHELLSDDALYTFMRGYTTRYCGPLINTANPPESALVKVLKGPCGETPLMPWTKCYEDDGELFGECVPPEYVDAIQRWIAAGAAR